MTRQGYPLWLDTLITALAPVLWGTTYIVTTELLPPDSPFTAALIRTLPAGVLLVLASRPLRLPRERFRLVVLAALNIGFFQALLFVAAYRLPGGLAAVVGAIQPLLVMLLAWGLDGCRPATVGVGAGLVGVLGMAVLLVAPGVSWDALGIATALAGAGCMAAGTYLSRRWRPELPLLAFTGWQLLVGGLMIAPLAWLLDPPLPELGLEALSGYLYLSLFGALLAYALWFRGIARLSPVAVSSLGLLSPLTAVLLGWVLLDESLDSGGLAGLVAVLGSVLVVQWSASRAAVAITPDFSRKAA